MLPARLQRLPGQAMSLLSREIGGQTDASRSVIHTPRVSEYRKKAIWTNYPCPLSITPWIWDNQMSFLFPCSTVKSDMQWRCCCSNWTYPVPVSLTQANSLSTGLCWTNWTFPWVENVDMSQKLQHQSLPSCHVFDFQSFIAQ